MVDSTTADLFTHFYRHLRLGLVPSAALREAQIAAIKAPGGHDDTVEWAAFELFAARQSHPDR